MRKVRSWWLGSALFLIAGLALRADPVALPTGPFDAGRYRALWEQSPFALASPVAVESSEYSLVGAAQFDGVSYASVVDKQNSGHFVVTSQTPAHGLTLLSIVRGQDASSTMATLQTDKGILKLKLEASTVPIPIIPPAASAATLPISMPPVSPGFFRNHPPRARVFVPPVFVPRPPPSTP